MVSFINLSQKAEAAIVEVSAGLIVQALPG